MELQKHDLHPFFWGDVMKSWRGSTKIVGWKMDHLTFGDFAASRVFEVYPRVYCFCTSQQVVYVSYIINHYTLLLYAWPEEKHQFVYAGAIFHYPYWADGHL